MMTDLPSLLVGVFVRSAPFFISSRRSAKLQFDFNIPGRPVDRHKQANADSKKRNEPMMQGDEQAGKLVDNEEEDDEGGGAG